MATGRRDAFHEVWDMNPGSHTEPPRVSGGLFGFRCSALGTPTITARSGLALSHLAEEDQPPPATCLEVTTLPPREQDVPRFASKRP